MKKAYKILILAIAIILLIIPIQNAMALDNSVKSSDVSVVISSPAEIKSKPVYNSNIEITVKNNTNKSIKNLTCYIVVVDMVKKMTLPVDEFGLNAYQTREIKNIPANGTYKLTIPVKFIYVGTFKLTACVMDAEKNYVVTSDPATVKMIATSKLNKTSVVLTAILVPILLTSFVIYLTKHKKRSKKS